MRLAKKITEANRAEIVRAVEACAVGSQIELIDDPRTLQQNRLMWWLLTDIAQQIKIGDALHPPESWKCAFLQDIGRRMEFMPSIDGQGVVAVGYSSSKISRAEMAEMITHMYAFGDQHGVAFRIDERRRGAA